MKKIILSTLFLIVVFSCKKEKVENTNESTVDSLATSVSESVPVAPSLKELNPQQTSELLKGKNDTLYVTNFFATWCGPCVREIPHFKEKMEELKGKPVKFTFISLDSKEDWNTKVVQFVNEQGIGNNTILLDGQMLDGNFFKTNFKTWDGGSIPFTYMKKGSKTDEFLGMMTKEELNSKISSLLK